MKKTIAQKTKKESKKRGLLIWQIEHIKKSLQQADRGLFASDFKIQQFFNKIKK